MKTTETNKTSKTASILNLIETRLKKNTLISQYSIQIFDKIIFFKYKTRLMKTTETNK